PEDDRPDVILLAAGGPTISWLPQDSAQLRALERFGTVVGLDGMDWFELAFPPKIVERLALVIKGQGIFRDRELYNFVGLPLGGPNRTGRLTGRRGVYGPAELDKLRLSLPCFAADLPPIRRRMRKREGGPGRSRKTRMSRPERMA